MNNVFEIPHQLPNDEEFVEPLARGPAIMIERIISTGQRTPEGKWYDQTNDEWVTVLQGSAALQFVDGKIQDLARGDWVLLPAGIQHRVIATSSNPPCIWLAIHGKLTA